MIRGACVCVCVKSGTIAPQRLTYKENTMDEQENRHNIVAMRFKSNRPHINSVGPKESFLDAAVPKYPCILPHYRRVRSDKFNGEQSPPDL